MKYPLISIVIATYNSERTLRKTLDSIKMQSYPKKRVEVLVIDGGSTDKTRAIAKEYDCKILPNPKTELIYAKYIGFLKAAGKYIMYLDSDEVLEDPTSLKLKYSAFKKNPRIKAVMLSGYKTPPDSSPINHYINEFGDPFSFFVYRESKGDNYLIKDFSVKYQKVKISDDKNSVVFNFSEVSPLPLIELWAGGSTVDLEYSRSSFPQIRNNPDLIAHLFYLLNRQNAIIAITKNDNTIHYSSQTFHKYLKKIASRIKNNVYQTVMGRGGFSGREEFQSFWFRLKKFLFIPYSLSIVLPAIDALFLVATRRKVLYLMHLPLCLYTSFIIIYYLFLTTLRIKPKIDTYGN